MEFQGRFEAVEGFATEIFVYSCCWGVGILREKTYEWCGQKGWFLKCLKKGVEESRGLLSVQRGGIHRSEQ